VIATDDPTQTFEASTPMPAATDPPAATDTPELILTPQADTTAGSTVLPQPSVNSGAIQIYNPGPGSKIVSPMVIYGYAVPGDKHKGRVDLYGEDGSVLTFEILQLNTVYKWAYFYWPLPFYLQSAGELARLSLSTKDQFGRLTAVNSIHLLLLPEGDSIVYPPGELDLTERCVIEQPAQGQKPSGGVLTVAGTMLPFNSLPLTVGLIGRDGGLLNSQVVAITPNGANPVPFRVEMPYTLDRGAWELLVISQYDDRIGGLMYLYSQEIFLNP
jgi:hypothetical protein